MTGDFYHLLEWKHAVQVNRIHFHLKNYNCSMKEVDFPIWNYGENGVDPDDYRFRFKAGNVWYDIQVDVVKRGQVIFGHEWEARVIERLCR